LGESSLSRHSFNEDGSRHSSVEACQAKTNEGGRARRKGHLFMFYVYILRSIKYPEKTYTGYTINLKQRFADHNYGESIYSSAYRPWQLEAYFAFREESKAIEFEKYLKSGSGRVFSKNHF
jgi:predicted GIY-YIG superfamily endonuclease